MQRPGLSARGRGAVHAVDSNPCQNALLELKAAAVRGLDHAGFWELFGAGRSPRAWELYRSVRQMLLPWAQRYWDRHIHFFAGQGWRKSFYYHGGWGLVVWLVVLYWKHCRGLRRPIENLVTAGSLEEQQHIYQTQLRDRLWTHTIDWLSSRRLPLALMGIPERQREFILRYPGGTFRWAQRILDELVGAIPLANNHFMHLYIFGGYTPSCCPEYLTPDGFARLKSGLLDRLAIHTSTVTHFLRRKARTYPALSCWITWTGWAPRRWRRNGKPSCRGLAPAQRIIFRSALFDVDYLYPVPVGWQGRQTTLGSLLRFDRERAADLHARDRVHMYGSFHIASLPDQGG